MNTNVKGAGEITDVSTGNEGVSFEEEAVVTDGTDNINVEYALDVGDADKASAAIEVIDQAIETVSSERSKLGALQNRLEHTISNLEDRILC